MNDITYSPQKDNKVFTNPIIQTEISEPLIKETNTRSSNINYEQTKANTNINSISNDKMISIINRINNNYIDNKNKKNDKDKKTIRDERKKTTVTEFEPIKFLTNQKDNYNLNQMNNLNLHLYSNSNNTKNTGVNTYSSASHIKKDLFNINENNLENNFNYTCLDLEVINSWNLPKGLKIHITKDHLENSLRNMNDGKIYFGFQKDLNLSEERPYIDYLLLPKDNEYDDKFIGVHFQIKYDENNFKYYIKDLGSGYGTFVKLIEPIKIKNNLLINIGDTFIVFTINENEEKNDILILKIFTGNEQSEIFEFKPEKKIILIGRDISSDVYIEDKMLSRKHCYIYYEKNGNNNEEKNNWFIKDGDVNGKKSTNDTWLYLLEDTLIFDQMIIKTNHNLLRCNCR